MRKTIDTAELKQIQLNMLKYFDDYCKENNLSYFLAYGTLIGALRHKGYIPWDDDIDVVMPRNDYNRLMNTFNKANKDSCLKVIDHNIDKRYYLSFGKLVDTRTVLKENIDNDYEIGVYIDIFPLDNLSNDYSKSKALMKYAFTYNRKLQFKTIKWDNNRSLLKNIILNLGKIALYLQTIDTILIKFDKYCQSRKGKKFTKYVGVMTGISSGDSSKVFRKEWFEKTEYALFEGNEYPIPIGSDHLLRQLYGDYMTPPPKEQQITHHSFKAWYK